jgi:sulfoxide reductase heme-binding subunit YedZ
MTWQLLPNILGFGSLLFYAITLLPGLLHFTNPELIHSKFVIWITKHRRNLGISAFFFGLAHGALIAYNHQADLTDPSTYIKYIQGVILLSIFFALAITSNNWSIHHLKSNWKKIHRLTYLVMFILVWHIIDKMQNNWSWFTPIGLLILFVLIALFSERKAIEILDKKNS